jgi:hypothetical protein
MEMAVCLRSAILPNPKLPIDVYTMTPPFDVDKGSEKRNGMRKGRYASNRIQKTLQ